MEISSSLLSWFDLYKRDLPFRKNRNPYRVWVSEIMLQQTQMKTVIPFYERWVNKLPTIGSVARTNIDSLLKLWEGLGYYSRARNLKKTAIKIIKDHNGRLPNSIDELKNLIYPVLNSNSVILVKASRFMRFEEITKILEFRN